MDAGSSTGIKIDINHGIMNIGNEQLPKNNSHTAGLSSSQHYNIGTKSRIHIFGFIYILIINIEYTSLKFHFWSLRCPALNMNLDPRPSDIILKWTMNHHWWWYFDFCFITAAPCYHCYHCTATSTPHAANMMCKRWTVTIFKGCKELKITALHKTALPLYVLPLDQNSSGNRWFLALCTEQDLGQSHSMELLFDDCDLHNQNYLTTNWHLQHWSVQIRHKNKYI